MGGERTEAQELGRRVKAARIYRNVTQAELADEIGHDRTTTIRWERGDIDKDYKRATLEAAASKVTDMPREFFVINFDDLPNMVRAWKQASRLPNPDALRDLVDEKLRRDLRGE
jgi:DNA-binding XRE family transcriptional regulator